MYYDERFALFRPSLRSFKNNFIQLLYADADTESVIIHHHQSITQPAFFEKTNLYKVKKARHYYNRNPNQDLIG